MAMIKQTEAYGKLIGELKKDGCIIVTGTDAPNMMTIGWGTTGIMWGKDVFMAAVRVSRFTKNKLDDTKAFTICVPKADHNLSDEILYAGKTSGRDVDKAKELGLKYVPSKTIPVPHIEGMGIVYECKVIYEIEMTGENLNANIKRAAYPEGDYHILYFGEILACHKY